MSEFGQQIKADRQTLTEMLRTIPGIKNAVPYGAGPLAVPGNAWVEFRSLTDPNRFGRTEWHLIVVLPPELVQAQQEVEDLIDAMIPVVSHELTIQRFDVVALNTGGPSPTTGSSTYALVCEGYR